MLPTCINLCRAVVLNDLSLQDKKRCYSLAIGMNSESFPTVAMILGFSERTWTVSEGDTLISGDDQFSIDIIITSMRTSEIAYTVGIRSVIEGQPIIEPSDNVQNPMFDGFFGTREANTINNLVHSDLLRVNTSILPPLRVTVRDDVMLEEEECFELSIFQVDPEEMTENFVCNLAGDEFLCEHTFCIADDDG